MSDDNEYDCPHCGKEDVGMFGHECIGSQLNTERIQNGLEPVYVDTRFSRRVKCPHCLYEFRS